MDPYVRHEAFVIVQRVNLGRHGLSTRDNTVFDEQQGVDDEFETLLSVTVWRLSGFPKLSDTRWKGTYYPHTRGGSLPHLITPIISLILLDARAESGVTRDMLRTVD